MNDKVNLREQIDSDELSRFKLANYVCIATLIQLRIIMKKFGFLLLSLVVLAGCGEKEKKTPEKAYADLVIRSLSTIFIMDQDKGVEKTCLVTFDIDANANTSNIFSKGQDNRFCGKVEAMIDISHTPRPPDALMVNGVAHIEMEIKKSDLEVIEG